MASLRRAWLAEFERVFRREFAAAFRGEAGQYWVPTISASEWAVAAVRESDQYTIGINLPYNYLLFRPQAVAQNVTTRLYEQAMSTHGELEPSAG